MLCEFLLYNKVNQLYVYIYPHIPSLLSLPHPPYPTFLGLAKHWAYLSELSCCFPLAIYFTFSSVYNSMLLSLRPSFPLPPSPQIHSLCLFLYSCPATRFISTIFFFRFHIYALAYGICFSLSDLLHSVWQTLAPSTSPHTPVRKTEAFRGGLTHCPTTGSISFPQVFCSLSSLQ